MKQKTVSRQRLSQLRNPQKSAARAKVAGMIRTGKIPSAKTLVCVDCRGNASEYDHYDGYANPLKIEPLCRECHIARGKKRGEYAGARKNEIVVEKSCGLCGEPMYGQPRQITQKTLCNNCTNDIKQARTLKKYHQLKDSPRFLYWKNKLEAMEATIKGKEVRI